MGSASTPVGVSSVTTSPSRAPNRSAKLSETFAPRPARIARAAASGSPARYHDRGERAGAERAGGPRAAPRGGPPVAPPAVRGGRPARGGGGGGAGGHGAPPAAAIRSPRNMTPG